MKLSANRLFEEIAGRIEDLEGAVVRLTKRQVLKNTGAEPTQIIVAIVSKGNHS